MVRSGLLSHVGHEEPHAAGHDHKPKTTTRYILTATVLLILIYGGGIGIVNRTHDGPENHVFPYFFTPCLVLINIICLVILLLLLLLGLGGGHTA